MIFKLQKIKRKSILWMGNNIAIRAKSFAMSISSGKAISQMSKKQRRSIALALEEKSKSLRKKSNAHLT